MPAAPRSAQLFLDSYARLAQESADPAWLAEMRAEAAARLAATGLPRARDEAWIYSDVAPIANGEFHRARSVGVPEAGTLAGAVLDAIPGARLVFVNGHGKDSLSERIGLADDVVLARIGTLRTEGPDRLREAMKATPHANGHAFYDLNTALFEDGVVLDIPDGVEVTDPIQVHLIMRSWEDGIAEHPRLIVRLGKGAKATLFERYHAQGPGARFTNAVTTIALGEGASLEHVRLQREGRGAHHTGLTLVRQAAKSTYCGVQVAAGAALCRQEVTADIDGADAECTLNGLSVLGGDEHVDNHTTIRHNVADGTSHELYKNILGGHARGAFTGRIVVARDAQRIDSNQQNHSLLLSTDAIAQTRPQLEIYADDVECAHGATIGQLDEDQAFYLRARGLTPLAARNLLIHAFAREVLDGVQSDAIRASLERVLASRLNVDAT